MSRNTRLLNSVFLPAARRYGNALQAFSVPQKRRKKVGNARACGVYFSWFAASAGGIAVSCIALRYVMMETTHNCVWSALRCVAESFTYWRKPRVRRHNQEQRHTNLRLGDIINLVQFNTVISFTRHSRDALALFWNCREGYISCWSSEPYILMMLMMMMRQSLYHWSVALCPSNWRCLDVGEVNEPCTNVLCAALMFHQPSSG